MSLQLFNTLTRRKEPFVPLKYPRVTYYNCGPTVYDVFHVGNARNFVFADVLRRYLAYSGFDVKFVQNLTDVDDKIINKAAAEGISPDEVARKYTEFYFKYTDALGVQRADVHPKATEHIDEMVAMIARLIERGHAYASDGDVYFAVESYKDYGRLSGKSLDKMQEGERLTEAVRDRKRSPLDFALWKAAKPGEPAWPSPWGAGRPGWHIECSVMSGKHLGETIDIHSGGADLAFPHHENEIAQSCCATGKEFVRTWVHNGFITFAGGGDGDDDADTFSDEAAAAKVSKSTMTAEQKELFNIDKALARFGARALRFFLVGAHYRSPLAFGIDLVEEAGRRATKIARQLHMTDQFLAAHAKKLLPAQAAAPKRALAKEFRAGFNAAMDDDLNTAQALAVISEALSKMNWLRVFHDKTGLGGGAPEKQSENLSELRALRRAIEEMLEVLGLAAFMGGEAGTGDEAEGGDAAAGRVLEALIAVRGEARAAKQFALSDRLRDGLAELGVALLDGAAGSNYELADGAAPPALGPLAELGIAVRAEARAAKIFALADAMRDRLAEAGLLLEDGASGTSWKLKEE